MAEASDTKAPKTPRYTKYEKARMVGSRALQISMGAPFLIELTQDQLAQMSYNPVAIAKKEFDAGVLPITVKRPLPEGMKAVEDIQEVEDDINENEEIAS